MSDITLQKSAINGVVTVPSSKSVAHRLILASVISGANVKINGSLKSKDILATLECAKGLGAKVDWTDDGVVLDASNLTPGATSFDVNESGSTMRFLLPILPLYLDEFTLSGKGRIGERPVSALRECMARAGVSVSGDYLPVKVSGRYTTNHFTINATASSQYITGMLLTLYALGGGTLKVEGEITSKGYIDITIGVLERFGANVIFKDNVYTLSVVKGELPKEVDVDADWSSACFMIVLGVLGGKVELKGLRYPDYQPDSVVLSVIKEMGGKVYFEDGVLVAERSKLNAVNFDADGSPDIVPILSVACANAKGVSTITGTRRLRIKESDRVQSVCDMLSAFGVKVESGENYIKIWGCDSLSGGVVDSQNDHRIAMSGAVLGSLASGVTTVKGIECVAKSYPDFIKDFISLGGDVYEL
ncbi:MAG: 3-phosphoshikimate 1-carboxyvinyltransferase [Clostridia bacterium]|nr:3-phosphoshikimate 1-carboxyvinyltransferase [Clostridia bacterium]